MALQNYVQIFHNCQLLWVIKTNSNLRLCHYHQQHTIINILLWQQLWVAGYYFHSANMLLAFLVLERSILKDEGPNIVTEPVGVQMPLVDTEENKILPTARFKIWTQTKESISHSYNIYWNTCIHYMQRCANKCINPQFG